MKTSVATAALLLGTAVSAAPWTAKRRAANEAKLARRGATWTSKSNPPLAEDFNSMQDTITINGDANVQYSSNWGGAVQIDSGITTVSGTITVPDVSVPSGSDSYGQYGGSAWVGIDGDTCQATLMQTGIDWVIENGEASYAAWYEWLPADSTDFNMDLSPGDTMTFKVVASSTTSGTAYITNESTGQSVQHHWTGQVAMCETNAEWIVEDFEQDGSLIPFSYFSDITFTDATYVANGQTNGVGGATIMDIRQNGDVLTNCNTDGEESVTCSYGGSDNPGYGY